MGIHPIFLGRDEGKGQYFRSTQRTILKYLGGGRRFTMIFRNVNPNFLNFSIQELGTLRLSKDVIPNHQPKNLRFITLQIY